MLAILKEMKNIFKEKSMNVNDHILLKYATTYEIPNISFAPKDCHYDEKIAAWIVNNTGEIYINSDGPKPETKKCDIETGEDQKKE
jgi:hypothetical protein